MFVAPRSLCVTQTWLKNSLQLTISKQSNNKPAIIVPRPSFIDLICVVSEHRFRGSSSRKLVMRLRRMAVTLSNTQCEMYFASMCIYTNIAMRENTFGSFGSVVKISLYNRASNGHKGSSPAHQSLHNCPQRAERPKEFLTNFYHS